jgi:hypothetical protein
VTAKVDITGQRFGRLVALRDSGDRRNSSVLWECRCDCGALVRLSVHALRSGNTRSCGCFRREEMSARFSRPLTERFWEKVNKDGPVSEHVQHVGQCWTWTGSTNQHVYGTISVHRKSILAHRVSWSLHFGDCPDGLCVLHVCDNPTCVNPMHLFLGSHQDNMADKSQKNRCADASGSKNPRAVLTESDVQAIRHARSLGAISAYVLADQYGVSPSTIWRALRANTWRTVQ